MGEKGENLPEKNDGFFTIFDLFLIVNHPPRAVCQGFTRHSDFPNSIKYAGIRK
jgi:hypothetical protein